MEMITIDDYIDAFKEMCNYDDIDIKCFSDQGFDAILQDDMDARIHGNLKITKEELSKVVVAALNIIQYGDTDDANDLVAIDEDFRNRFPDGR